MEEILASLKKFRETKELTKLLGRLDPAGRPDNNVATQLLRLYQEDLIGRAEYLAIRAKVVMGHYFNRMRHFYPEFKGGLYFYDTDAIRIWNASVSHLPDQLNEYTQGLSVEQDVPDHAPDPVYTSDMLLIEDVLRSDHPIAVNHYDMYDQASIRSFVTVPLLSGGESIGYQFISAEYAHRYTEEELSFLTAASEYLIQELAAIKPYMVAQLERSRLHAGRIG
ncbi:GAF domain-containing protein [Cohnella sp. JJ-181]|uniref:GAF domain-containing protein n=1 Tax=Cohnella rhizoplanae TaxID=2974897 RepID=UPI0022FFAFEA|nr:GAF domain-containing protein [Cohnella sp. JJ-181]CAI6079906.1 hypothetical protein COHCIP112018_02849 [Cohnella sp. JJ-181]